MARIALWLAVAALAAAPASAAEETVEAAKPQALAHAARAKVHYDLGEYQQAAEEYILVYRIRPLPSVLYNIAQSYRKAGQYEKAKQFYESYLRETRDPEDRATIKKALKEIEELLAKEKKAKDGPPQGVAQDRGLAPPPTTAAATPPSLPAAPPQTAPTPPQPAAVAQSSPPASTSKPAPGAAAPQAAQVDKPAPTPTVAVPATGTQVASATTARTTLPAGPQKLGPPTTSKQPAGLGTAQPAARSHTAAWILAGASAVALGTGGAFGVKTINSGSSGDAQKANILYAAGGALAIASAALFFIQF